MSEHLLSQVHFQLQLASQVHHLYPVHFQLHLACLLVNKVVNICCGVLPFVMVKAIGYWVQLYKCILWNAKVTMIARHAPTVQVLLT